MRPFATLRVTATATVILSQAKNPSERQRSQELRNSGGKSHGKRQERGGRTLDLDRPFEIEIVAVSCCDVSNLSDTSQHFMKFGRILLRALEEFS